jgi:hypothetical protein
MPKTMKILAALLLGSLVVACARLPEQVPWQVEFTVESGRLLDVWGAEVLADGKPVATMGAENSEVIAVARGTSPKAELRQLMNATFSLRIAGACGPVELPLGQISPDWRALSDRQVAQRIADDGRFPLILSRLQLPARHDLFVDRGGSAAVLEVGTVSIPREVKQKRLSLAGCAAKVPVTADGKLLGELDASAPGHLVTLEPGVCHVFEEVLYGSAKGTLGSQDLPADAVVTLPGAPDYFLERAPQSRTVSRQRQGAVHTELLRSNCR